MAVSKVVLNGTTLIDTTDKTVTNASMLSGVTALKNDGTTATGEIVSRTSSDIIVNGNEVRIPKGNYSGTAIKTVSSGTAGTPTATKGTVSNHSVSVTPSVTNTTGYITGSTIEGTPVTVTASELESGTLEITENGTGIDVTGYAAVDVDVPSSGGVTVNPLSVNQNGTYTAPTGTAYSPVTVNVSGGGGSAEEKQVNFIDYDGTILYSYTAAEANALTELPANPSHSGLTAQGWNWTLAQIKAQLTALPDGPVWVGQMYVTASGATEIDIELDDPERLNPYLTIAPDGSVSVDWGDGTTPSTVTGTGLTSVKFEQHIYQTTGNYTIKITVVSGSFSFYGSGDFPAILSVYGVNTSRRSNRTYSKTIKRIRIGASAIFGSNYAFAYCSNLESITLPSSITNFGTYAFHFCYALKSITIPSGITSIGNYSFNSCIAMKNVSVPASVTTFGTYSFGSCYALESISFPTGLTAINGNAFQYCYALRGIDLPSSITTIGNTAFGDCRSIEKVIIPSGVTSIGSSAFQYCYALKTVVVNDGVRSISSNAFINCYALESLTLPSSIETIYSSAFNNCVSLKSIAIPNGITIIPTYLFSGCYSLINVVIPSNVTSIGDNAFSNCRALENVSIPSGVTSIGSRAFYWCLSLETLVIPESVTSISGSAFATCTAMQEYHFLPTTPPTLGTNVFSSIQSGTKIYVPVGSLEAYQTATNWSTYASYMEEEPA